MGLTKGPPFSFKPSARGNDIAWKDMLGTGQKVWGGGWAGAFGNVVGKKHMTHPLHSAQKWLTHP